MALDEGVWEALLSLLLPLVIGWVYSAHLSAWSSQEVDVGYDIVFSAIRKMIEYIQREQQKGVVISSLEGLAIVIARNQFHDTRRKDSRLLRGEIAIHALEASWEEETGYSVEETVMNQLHEEELFRQVAERVRQLPPKEQQAILTDIALRVQKQGDFDCQVTPLRQAFIDVGIFLEDYLPLVAETAVMRSRRASLASLGYRHITQSIHV